MNMHAGICMYMQHAHNTHMCMLIRLHMNLIVCMYVCVCVCVCVWYELKKQHLSILFSLFFIFLEILCY